MRIDKIVQYAISAIALALLVFCQKPEPLRLGFVGGLTGGNQYITVE